MPSENLILPCNLSSGFSIALQLMHWVELWDVLSRSTYYRMGQIYDQSATNEENSSDQSLFLVTTAKYMLLAGS